MNRRDLLEGIIGTVGLSLVGKSIYAGDNTSSSEQDKYFEFTQNQEKSVMGYKLEFWKGKYMLIDKTKNIPLRKSFARCDCLVIDEKIAVYDTKDIAKKAEKLHEKHNTMLDPNTDLKVVEINENSITRYVKHKLTSGRTADLEKDTLLTRY